MSETALCPCPVRVPWEGGAVLRQRLPCRGGELLRRSDESVLAIAGQLGYDNASKFARAFRQVMGVSPSDYRKGSDSCAPEASIRAEIR